MRTSLRLIVIALAVILTAVAIMAGLSKPCDRRIATYKAVEISEGDDLNKVAATLEDEGIIDNASAFSAVARMSFSRSFKPGYYYLSPSMNSFEIARTLSRGVTTSSGFTIPAGYNVEQIASSLERDGIADKKAFLEAAASEDLQEIDYIGANNLGSEQVEGFLFPGDYQMESSADESMMIITMLNQFTNFFNDDYKARADELGLSVREIVYIASMIETETSIDKERAEISAVIHNKYNMDLMPADEIKKAPLCSPSEKSLTAALFPEDNDNIYYVYSSKLDGSHVFTADKEEYDKLLQEYNEAAAKEKENKSSDDKDDKSEAAE